MSSDIELQVEFFVVGAVGDGHHLVGLGELVVLQGVHDGHLRRRGCVHELDACPVWLEVILIDNIR